MDGLTPCVGCRQGDERAAAIAESGFTGKLERNGPVRGRSTERAAKDFARLPTVGSGVARGQNRVYPSFGLE